MTTMTGPDCAVMFNLIGIHTRVCYLLLPLAMLSCDEVGSDVHGPYKGARHQMGREQVGDKPQRAPAFGGEHESSTSSAASLCVLQEALSFCTRYHLCSQRVALVYTRQLRSQGPVSVHAHCNEG